MALREQDDLVGALVALRGQIAAASFPLDVPSATRARAERAALLDQLDDYLLPRWRDAGAPLLVVVGGSTGAGKSTLVSSVLGSVVSPAGVLRPTTRWPVLVHHPDDLGWFSGDRVLPGLARVGVAAGGRPGDAGGGVPGGASSEGSTAGGLRLVASDVLPPGLALLDAPDIDSIAEENRALAGQLLGAADVWLFVTTAARYADAVPWELLTVAARRSVRLAVVLDRVDDGTQDAVSHHLRAMLDARGLAEADVLLVPESVVDPDSGLLPAEAVGLVADWLGAVGQDPARRAESIAQTRGGATRDVLRRTGGLADAVDEQRVADARLRAAVTSAYESAATEVARATSDGTMLRGEVLARWQEVVGTGDLFRSLEATVSRWRDRLVASVRGRRPPEPALAHAIGHGLEAVVLDAADEAAERVHAAWRGDVVGPALLGGLGLSRSSAGLRSAVAEQIRGWQGDVLGLVEQEGAGKRSRARALSFGVNGLGAALMVAVFASTGGLTGAEIGIAGGSAVLAQRVLEAVFGDEAVRQLARTAHLRLDERVRELLAGEARRFTDLLDAVGVGGASGDDLRAAAPVVRRALLGAERAGDEASVGGPPPDEAAGAPGRNRLRGAGLRPWSERSGRPGFPGDEDRVGSGRGAGGADAGAGSAGAATPDTHGLRAWWRRRRGRA
ncbi:ABC transporter [Cellulomonas hominis]